MKYEINKLRDNTRSRGIQCLQHNIPIGKPVEFGPKVGSTEVSLGKLATLVLLVDVRFKKDLLESLTVNTGMLTLKVGRVVSDASLRNVQCVL